MWETMISTNQGLAEKDARMIKYLMDHNVETETTISYLDFEKTLRIKGGYKMMGGQIPVMEILNFRP